MGLPLVVPHIARPICGPYARASDGPGKVSMDLCIHTLALCMLYILRSCQWYASHE